MSVIAGTGTASPKIETFLSAADMIATLRPVEPVYCLYGQTIAQAVGRFRAGFPGDILYAVKANPEPSVLRHLHNAGIRHFDTASLAEIALIRELLPDAQCYYMAPVRPVGAVEEAYRRYGLRHFAVDCREEYERLARTIDAPAQSTLMVRIKTALGVAIFELSSKFGTSPQEAARLMARAHADGFRVGLTFHVGSQCREPKAYAAALELIQTTIAQANVPLAVLDIGGGFPAAYPRNAAAPLEAYLETIRTSLAKLALPPGTPLLAEPGRALVAEGVSVVAQVALRHGEKLYLNDGIYGSFAELKLAQGAIHLPARAARLTGRGQVQSLDGPMQAFTLYGPTCDSYDVFPDTMALPQGLATGDYIEFGMLGAYSIALRTHFNGFYPNRFVDIAGQSQPPQP